MKLPAVLSRQLGPFPVGVWLLIIGAGITLGVVVNRRIGTVSEEPVILDPEATGPDPYTSGTGGTPPAFRGPTILPPAPPSSAPYVEPPASNDEWVAAGTRAVATGADGAPSALAAFEALSAYVNGEPLTAAQRGIVNDAMVKLGPPPFGVIDTYEPPPTPEAPVPTQPPGGAPYVPTQPTYSGTLVNTETGRVAFTGPSGEGGFARQPTAAEEAKYGKAVSWQMPDGRVAWYVPGQHIDPGNIGALANYR